MDEFLPIERPEPPDPRKPEPLAPDLTPKPVPPATIIPGLPRDERWFILLYRALRGALAELKRWIQRITKEA